MGKRSQDGSAGFYSGGGFVSYGILRSVRAMRGDARHHEAGDRELALSDCFLCLDDNYGIWRRLCCLSSIQQVGILMVVLTAVLIETFWQNAVVLVMIGAATIFLVNRFRPGRQKKSSCSACRLQQTALQSKAKD